MNLYHKLQNKAVLDAGRELWIDYFSMEDKYQVRERLKLNRPDVG